ncbi:MAG: hypothetical protein U0930_04475 [Pirellulales bacterium]
MPWKGKPFGWGQPVPYLSFLPEAEEASINILRQLAENLADGQELNGGSIKVTVSFIEPPSIDLATDLFLKSLGLQLTINRTVSKVPKPDPRKSKAKFPLWKYGMFSKQAKPAVVAPDNRLISACAELASQPYDFDGNWLAAELISKQFAIDAIKPMLAVMVHPPLVRNGTPAWVWVQRVQLAAAQCVACIEMQRSVRIENSILIDVLQGPIDWVIDAAMIALMQRARKENLDSEWLGHQFFNLMNRLPTSGYWSSLKVALHCVLLLPNLDPNAEAEVQQILESIYSSESSN